MTLMGVGVALISFLTGGAVLLWLLRELPGLRGVVLHETVGRPDPDRRRRVAPLLSGLDDEETGEPVPLLTLEPGALVGATGVALSDLRPGGFALLNDERVDVVTRGDYITAGEPIEVIADEGYRRVVRRCPPRETGASVPRGPGVRDGAQGKG